MISDITANAIFLVLSVLLIFWSADLVITGISGYARRLGMRDYLSGTLVVAMAASLPEIVSSLTALFAGKEDMVFGTILGTNMVHTALVTGLIGVVGRNVKVETTVLKKALIPFWIALMTPLILILISGGLTRIDGIILVSLFLVYVVWLWKQESTGLHRAKLSVLWKSSLIFLGALFVILIAGNILVFSSINLSTMLGIPGFFVSLTVIAMAGALPDLAVALRSLKNKHQDIGVGDVLGSIAIEFLLFFGILAIVNPITIPLSESWTTITLLGVSLTALLFGVRKQKITWKTGIILLGIYILFITIEVMKVVLRA